METIDHSADKTLDLFDERILNRAVPFRQIIQSFIRSGTLGQSKPDQSDVEMVLSSSSC